METSNSKKRVGQQIHCKDKSPQQNKRLKSKHSDTLLVLLKTLSELSDEQKNIVRKIGFGSILDFTCCSNINDIFQWLLNHFDSNSATVSFENAFSFSLTPSIVHTILAIPFGSKSVQTKPCKIATDFIHESVKMENPTVEYLCDLLLTDLDEVSFIRTFMLALLSAFIAPTGSSGANPCYYQNLVDVLAIPQLDWCSFTLNWLIRQIKKYELRKQQEIQSEIGGCKIVLVISYFEFLITPAFNLGTTVPRLPLWTTHVVNSYIALDSIQGSRRRFGSLDRKHISSTPFKGSDQQMQLPVQIQQYIDFKFQGTTSNEDQKKIQIMTTNFFKSLVLNSIPSVKSYVDDLIQLCSSRHQPNIPTAWSNESVSQHDDLKGQTCTEITTNNNGIQEVGPIIPGQVQESMDRDLILCLQKQLDDFFQKEFFFMNVQYPGNSTSRSTNDLVQGLAKKMSEKCVVSESLDWSFPGVDDYNFGIDFYPEIMRNSEAFELLERTETFEDWLDKQLQDLIDYGRQQRASEWTLQYNIESKQKFNEQTMEFYLPGTESSFQGSIQTPKPATPTAPVSLRENHNPNQIRKTPQSTPLLSSHVQVLPTKPSTILKQKQQVVGSSCGLSLNERVLGRRIPPKFDESRSSFPSFEIMGQEHENTTEFTEQVPSKVESVDPFLSLALQQWDEELKEKKSVHNTPRQLSGDFIPGSSKQAEPEWTPTPQVIFPNSFEHHFYIALTTCKQDFSPRIFEIQKVWVDQRTLALSMSPGGWIHPHVIDCFGKLTTTDQLQRTKEGKLSKNEVLIHVVIKDDLAVLMDPVLNVDDPGYRYVLSTANVGFRLENAGLVHIPCPNDKQWILIVANFMDETFDVLNPDYKIEKFSSIINTVVYNFKHLFASSYPGCRRFNIRDFQVRYVAVPKFNFRYDSGIFVIQFIRWYNGLKLLEFSNADVQAIREKVSCNIVINRYNEHQVLLTRQFLSKHAPNLLR